MKTLFITTLLVAGMLTTYTQACTRVVYLGKNGMVVTGRTMDWKEDLKSNIYVFPRGIERAGADKGNTIHWKSKYSNGLQLSLEGAILPQKAPVPPLQLPFVPL